jgi:hypothetical protein
MTNNSSNPTDHPPGNYPKDKIRGALFGAIVGDALGVPVEFRSREYLRQNPITDMVGFGTYDQPPGTWSDDTSLMLCTLESLLNGFDPERMGASTDCPMCLKQQSAHTVSAALTPPLFPHKNSAKKRRKHSRTLT